MRDELEINHVLDVVHSRNTILATTRRTVASVRDPGKQAAPVLSLKRERRALSSQRRALGGTRRKDRRDTSFAQAGPNRIDVDAGLRSIHD